MPGRRRIIAVICLIVSLITAGVSLARWSVSRPEAESAATQIAPTSLNPASPSKEYIYAGGRLIATEESAPVTYIRLTGIAFGSTPSSQSGLEYYRAVDGGTSTFFDYVSASGGFTGIDLGTAKKIVKVRYFPRSGFASRMSGGKFQGSNSQTSGYVDLFTVPSTPPGGQWSEGTVTNTNTYRYVRYLSPTNGFCNVAEIEFYTDGSTNFSDVSPSDPFYQDVQRIAARGVTLGCGPGIFCPDGFVTREQMAAFIIRALGVNPPVPASQRFTDVPPSNGFYPFIEEMAVRQITAGCGAAVYCPANNVPHEQMATFISRALGQFNPPTPGFQRFTDVPPTNPFYAFIEYYAGQEQIWPGCNGVVGPNFCPSAFVTRRQMAHILVRAFGDNW